MPNRFEGGGPRYAANPGRKPGTATLFPVPFAGNRVTVPGFAPRAHAASWPPPPKRLSTRKVAQTAGSYTGDSNVYSPYSPGGRCVGLGRRRRGGRGQSGAGSGVQPGARLVAGRNRALV